MREKVSIMSCLEDVFIIFNTRVPQGVCVIWKFKVHTQKPLCATPFNVCNIFYINIEYNWKLGNNLDLPHDEYSKFIFFLNKKNWSE